MKATHTGLPMADIRVEILPKWPLYRYEDTSYRRRQCDTRAITKHPLSGKFLRYLFCYSINVTVMSPREQISLTKCPSLAKEIVRNATWNYKAHALSIYYSEIVPEIKAPTGLAISSNFIDPLTSTKQHINNVWPSTDMRNAQFQFSDKIRAFLHLTAAYIKYYFL